MPKDDLKEMLRTLDLSSDIPPIGYLNPIILRVVDSNASNSIYSIESDLFYYSPLTELTYVIPEGFITDLASIPKILQSVVKSDGELLESSIIHDYLYTYTNISRSLADEVFREAMTIYKVKRWKLYISYWTVRLFGGSRFDNDKVGL